LRHHATRPPTPGLSAAPAGAAPLVEYAFDEGSRTNAVNTGTLGAALDGTLTDGAGHSTDTPLGGGSSLALDGVNDFAGLIDDFRIHPTALDPSLLGGGFASLGHDCVPEPSLALLLGAGLIGLLGKRARANA
jgi:hypothetical protein